MRPAKLTATFLLMALTLQWAAAAPTGSLDKLCQTVQPCEGMDDGGWFQMGDRCVKFFMQPLSFKDAETACSQHKSGNNSSGHLVSIHSYSDLDHMVCAVYKVAPHRPECWIGLYLAFSYEDYMMYDWSDGTVMDFTYFSYGEPGSHKCIESNYNGWGEWSDMDCKALRPYVCAVKV